jgi:hypothetical protein
MSGNLSSSQFQLELLPDELFLEIFQYMDLITLRSFKDLNQRINRIIQSLKVNIVVRNQEKNEFDYLSILAPVQIIHLEIRHYWLSLNFNSMTELRSLTLDCTYLSREQLEQVIRVLYNYKLFINSKNCI